jgi:hypothetical protein
MPTTYTPNPNNDPATYQLPSDLDAATAESINAAVRALADKNAHAYQVFAQLAQANVFTRGQVVDEVDAGIALVATTNYPSDHPGSPGNRWKLIFAQPTNGASSVGFYAGGDPVRGHWAIVYNARWIVSSQQWQQQHTGRDSFALIQEGRGLSWRIQPEGQSAGWLDWPTDLGPSIPSANFSAAGEFNYVEPKPRTTYVKMGSAAGGSVTWSGFNRQVVPTSSGSYIWWEIDLPPDAVLLSAAVRVGITSPPDVFHLTSRNAGTWNLLSSNTNSAEAELLTINAGSATAGPAVLPFAIPPGGITVSDGQQLAIRWTPHTGNYVDGIRLDWLDPGPRNR